MKNIPQLTVVINMYNNEREAPRSLFTLSAKYQKNVEESDYKVIVMDNGSKKPISESLVKSFGSNFEYHYFKSEFPSPCQAMNFGINRADTEFVTCMIDGAHLLSPGVIHHTLKAIKAYENPVILTLPLHLGPYMQFYSIEDGYDQLKEDELLAGIPWQENGYSLFNICNLPNYERNFFSGLYESNCFTATKKDLLKYGGFNEKFTSSGGGYVNLDIFKKLVEDPKLQAVTLIGEASFHQFHRGVTTNTMKKDQPLPIYKEEYNKIYGEYYSGPTYKSDYIGQITQESKSKMPLTKWNVYITLINRLKKDNKLNQALQILELAKEINPYRPDIYVRFGQIYAKQEKWHNAITNFQKAIDISPVNEIDQYVGLANVYMETNKIKKAEEILQQAAIIDPNNAAIPLSVAYYYLNKKEFQKAKSYCEEASKQLSKRGNEERVYVKLATAYKKLNELNKALETINLLEEKKPNSPVIFTFKGGIFKEQNLFKKAESSFLKALKLNCNNPFGIHFQLADLFTKNNQYSKAINHCRLAKKLKADGKNNNILLQKLENILKQQRRDSKHQSFIFTHIPKCGGTSVRNHLFNLAIDNGLDPKETWMPGTNGIHNLNNIRVLGFLGEVIPQGLIVLADHSYFNVEKDYEIKSLTKPFYFTILREPYERFVSNYYYFCFARGVDGLKDVHLSDIPMDKLEKILDREGHTLIRFLGNFKNDEVLPNEVDQSHLEIARKNLLESYSLFGIFDKMEKTIELLNAKMPSWLKSDKQLPFLNKGQVDIKTVKVKDAVKNKILKYIELDSNLYKLAEKEFQKNSTLFNKKNEVNV